jgi:hypothetical protein
MGVQVRSSLLFPDNSLKLFLTCRPDRWDNLPDAAKAQPGLYSNLMSFSVGPRVSGMVVPLLGARLISYPRSPVLGCDSQSSKSRFSSTCLSPISPSTILGLTSSSRTCEWSSCSISCQTIFSCFLLRSSVFTRPYIKGRYKEGSQLPLRVVRLDK